jgi:hypothetical protein
MPDIPKEVFKEMPEIIITENGVEKLLQNLNPNKAMWSGRVSLRVDVVAPSYRSDIL